MPGTSMLNELEREHAIRSAVRPAGRGGGGSLGGGSTASGEHSTWSRIAAAAEDDLEEIEHTLHRADLLNIEEIRLGKLKELKGVSEIQKTMMTTTKGLDSMTDHEQKRIMVALGDIFKTWGTTSGAVIGADALLMTKKTERTLKIISVIKNNILEGLTRYERRRAKDGQVRAPLSTPPPTPRGESGGASENNEDRGEEHNDLDEERKVCEPGDVAINRPEAEQYEILKRELAVWNSISRTPDPLAVLLDEEVVGEIMDFQSIEYIRESFGAANTKILNVLTAMCRTVAVERMISESKLNGVVESKDTMEGRYGIPTSACSVVAKITLGATHVTVETFRKMAAEVSATKINFSTLKEGGFERVVNDMKAAVGNLEMVYDDLKSDTAPHQIAGLDSLAPDIYWLARGMCEGRGLDPVHNPSVSSDNYELVRHELRDLMTATNNSSAPDLDDRWYELSMGLKKLDAMFHDRYVAKKEKATEKWTLNANEVKEGRGKGKGKGGRGGRDKRPAPLCFSSLRRGFCEHKDCHFRGMGKDMFDSRIDCTLNDDGECPYGRGCKYRHAGDPRTMTSEMVKKCVHQKSGNVLNVVNVDVVLPASEDV